MIGVLPLASAACVWLVNKVNKVTRSVSPCSVLLSSLLTEIYKSTPLAWQSIECVCVCVCVCVFLFLFFLPLLNPYCVQMFLE